MMDGEMLLMLIGLFVVSFAFSLIINKFLLKFAKTLGIRNTGEAIIRWSATSKPSLGGISFFIVFLFSVIWVSFLRNGDSEFFNLQTFGLIISVIIGFLLGLFDDAYNTKPWIKFFTQIMCGIILIATGTHIQLFEIDFFNYALTVFWVVGMMNSINMLDNMDGITTIVSISVLLSFLLSIFLGSEFQNPYLIIILGVMASLAGFMFYNWHPSKMYMGDTGSQFLGVLLAALGIQFLWNGDFGFTGALFMQQLLSVLIVFALPIIDTTTVFIKRISAGNSPFIGGKDHTTHHISYLGVSDKWVAIIFAILSAISVVLFLGIDVYFKNWGTFHVLVLAGYFFLLFGVLFIIANLNKHQN